MKINQKQLDKLINTLNHKVSLIESDIRWIKWIMVTMFIALIINRFI